VDLFWDDWTTVNQDYDLFLFEFDDAALSWNTIRAASTNIQSGGPGQTPQEWLDYTVSGAMGAGAACPAGTGWFGILVAEYSTTSDRNLQIYSNLIETYYHVENRSLTFPADSASVVSVAAIDVTSHAQESYSSEGPILAPGGGLPTLRLAPLAGPQKPDMASFANVDTESYGPGVFNGTSAATPHVAGMAALIKDNNPAFTADQIEQELLVHASYPTNDLGTPGHDYEYGWGMARFYRSPNAVDLARFQALPEDASIRVEWETAQEIDNLGFNLYRGAALEGPRLQLNGTLIPSQAPGTAVGAAYEWLDQGVAPGVTYYYWLEDVDVYGQATLHGPVEAAVQVRRLIAPLRPRLLPYPAFTTRD